MSEVAPLKESVTAPARPLRIALLGYRSNPFSGGQGIYIKYVARALRDAGHQVDVISGAPYPNLDEDIGLIKLPGLNLFETQHPGRALRWRHLTSATDTFEWLSKMSGGFPEPYTFGRRIVSFFKQNARNYDVIHDNQSLSYGVLALQKMGLKVVSTIHHPITYDRDIALAHELNWGMRLLIRRWHHFLSMQTKVARQLNNIVTVSESSKRDLCRAFGVPETRVNVIVNGVDANTFKPLPHITREPRLLITTASADQPLKGTQYLIPAFARLREMYPDLHLIFIGRPKPGGTTAKLIDQHNLAGAITFRHGISAGTIVELYARATIAVVPSEYEGFGLPAAEAMACAVPVVATNGGALPEVVGDAGMTVPKSNPAALTEAIATLLDDKEKRENLGARGRLRMLEEFCWSRVASRLTDYYNQVLDNES
ncbi:MAG: glycosyltransferase family 4 protein [Pseudomonadaceae bacterium]|nr:glycosyltransferase family 4 protein [Pseudomonadaceae bacterium]